ncbi:glycosyltransferase [Mesorhizobium tamadayense]|uniref:glycosyltransferase n=1 Tax=Mesorhizobium tamadayense TaxID=425306 RepID=UPI001FDF08BC|nr:glycosyltransferase [Mesorhizobium tamadayense]
MGTRDGAAHIGEQLQSLLAQSWPHVELWVSDDSSIDATLAIAEAWRSRWLKGSVTLVQSPRKGFAANFRSSPPPATRSATSRGRWSGPGSTRQTWSAPTSRGRRGFRGSGVCSEASSPPGPTAISGALPSTATSSRAMQHFAFACSSGRARVVSSGASACSAKAASTGRPSWARSASTSPSSGAGSEP